jgi:hypothetical protein
MGEKSIFSPARTGDLKNKEKENPLMSQSYEDLNMAQTQLEVISYLNKIHIEEIGIDKNMYTIYKRVK